MNEYPQNPILISRHNILIFGLSLSDLFTISSRIELLHGFLNRIGLEDKRVQINIVTNKAQRFESIQFMNKNINIFETADFSKNRILKYVSDLDADVVLDGIKIFNKNDIAEESDNYLIVQDIRNDFHDTLNAICAGWSVPWNFSGAKSQYLMDHKIPRKRSFS